MTKQHAPKKKPQFSKTEPKWFEIQIVPDDFTVKQDKQGKYYAQHKKWKKNIWIGPYKAKEELDKVIASYVSVTKKPFGSRKELKNVHSILIEKDEDLV